ncbi:MAG TPA: class I SAM-dependent methyltransferase [Patescibacteria group bacterium]
MADIETLNTYNKYAVDYDKETKDFWEKFPTGFLDYFAGSIGKGKILDLGSGPGRDGLLLSNRGLDVVCLDASLSMTELTKSKNLISIQADLLKIPFKNESFDGVWAYTSLLHIRRKYFPQALSEINRILKPGGKLALGLIEGDKQGYFKSSEMQTRRFFTYYQFNEVQTHLKNQGFDLVFTQTFQPKSKKYLHFLASKKELVTI